MLTVDCLALGATSALAAEPSSRAKRATIDAIQVPLNFSGTFAYARGLPIPMPQHLYAVDPPTPLRC